MTAYDTKRTLACTLHMSAFDPKRTSPLFADLTAEESQSLLPGGGALAIAPFWSRARDTEVFGLGAEGRGSKAFSRKAALQ